MRLLLSCVRFRYVLPLISVDILLGFLGNLHYLVTVLVTKLSLVLIKLHLTTSLRYSVLINLALSLLVLFLEGAQLVFELVDFFSFELHDSIELLLDLSNFLFFLFGDLRCSQLMRVSGLIDVGRRR